MATLNGKLARISGFLISLERSTGPCEPARPTAGGQQLSFGTGRGCVQIQIDFSPHPTLEVAPAASDDRCLLLGDDQEWRDDSTESYFANAVTLRVGTQLKVVEVRSSISGFPPVFLYQNNTRTILASTIHKIASHPGIRLEFDPQGVTELGTIGHPVGHRTLYKGLSVLPAGRGLRLLSDAEIELLDPWNRPAAPAYSDYRDYIAAQVLAFRSAVRRIDIERSFLSLTAGLDTRAIFAVLAHDGRRIPAYTITGPSDCLDALRARELCEAYGIPHRRISIDRQFFDSIGDSALDASKRSGGLASLGQALEVYFCRSLSSDFDARLSGNLGNQIGRSGTEGAGMRGSSLAVLSGDFRYKAHPPDGEHWLDSLASEDGTMDPLVLIQQESLFASLGNYCVGSSFFVQQTPYADRILIRQKLREPAVDRTPRRGPLGVRLRDLRHRFLGEPRDRSFQREAIAQCGGFAATCPINWGWKASGGVSLAGMAMGLRALADVLIAARFQQSRLTNFFSSTGIRGFSGFQTIDISSQPRVKQLVYDTLSSASLRQNGVLDRVGLDEAMSEVMPDKACGTKLSFALDVALAERCFLTNGSRKRPEW